MNDNEKYNYSLDKINKMRIKSEKNKKVLKAIFTVIAFVLMFSIGFVSGFYINKFPNEQSVEVSGDVKAENDVKKKVQVKTNQINSTEAETQKLNGLKQSFINKISQKYPSVVFSFGIKNLDTGATVIYNDIQMNSASVIKLFIMETIYDEVAKGNYELTEEKQHDLNIMITESDNKATNRFIDDFGGDNEVKKITDDNIINKTIKDGGYKHTEINRKMHDTTPPEGPTGYENYTSTGDVLKLLEGIYTKSLFKEPYNTEALNLLKNQKRRTKIPAKITEKYADVIVLNKTGELSQVENDVALITSDKFNLAFVIFINEIPKKADGSTDYDLKNEIQTTISDLGLELVELYKVNEF